MYGNMYYLGDSQKEINYVIRHWNFPNPNPSGGSISTVNFRRLEGCRFSMGDVLVLVNRHLWHYELESRFHRTLIVGSQKPTIITVTT